MYLQGVIKEIYNPLEVFLDSEHKEFIDLKEIFSQNCRKSASIFKKVQSKVGKFCAGGTS